MKLSKNFTRAEIEHSNTAKRLDISNEMSDEHLENMQRVIDNLIQPMRDAIGPIRISSGYRSPKLNKAIGGSSRSQHCKGEALDLQFWKEGKMNNKVIYDWVIDSGIEFDQMINEFDYAWIHISLKSKENRKEILEAYKNEKGKTKYKYV
ncbi:MAG: putative peptidase M15 [Prokaryotic dsDNA virus sp.]|nr:MAG: putative peptidase M15 [Prokaryotic dsDNA virus sp.]|tara:strand:+ start:929 stop:1378 length:450 start_codon:yes stop_codon:yes gene_type:complete